MTIRHKSPDTEFFAEGCSVAGTAHFIAETEMAFDADIGGRDGLEVTSCELLHVDMAGAKLDRDWLVKFIGEHGVAAYERDAMEAVQAEVDAGDFAEAA